MKKPDKKAESKKSGKKKKAKKEDSYKLASKQLQKEFNKKMKALVLEIKKDTQNTIKSLIKEANNKIHAGSDFIMNDVLKSAMAQYESLTGADTDQKDGTKQSETHANDDKPTTGKTSSSGKKNTGGSGNHKKKSNANQNPEVNTDLPPETEASAEVGHS